LGALLESVQVRSGVYAACYSLGIRRRGLFQGRNWHGVKLITLLSGAEGRNEWSYTSVPPYMP
jgi:hypothetical protein